MRTLFFGTPDFAVPCLRALAARTEVVAVVTAPDAASGRGHSLRPPPVRLAAEALGLPVQQPLSIRDLEFLDRLAALGADLGVVVAYGRLLGRRLLGTPRLGFVNVHASLLPVFRGAAPIQRAVMAGCAESGVSIMRMVLGLDAGPVYLARSLPLAPRETAGTLHDRLQELGARTLGEFLDLASTREVPEPVPQDASLATYAEKVTTADEWLDWREPALALDRRIRGLAPRPGASARFRGGRLRILEAEPVGAPAAAAPSVVGAAGTLSVSGGEPQVACGEGSLRLVRVQAEGRNPVGGKDFVNGARVQPGERLEPAGPPSAGAEGGTP